MNTQLLLAIGAGVIIALLAFDMFFGQQHHYE